MIRNMFKSQFTPFNIFAVFSAFLLSAVIIIFAINFDRHSLNKHRAEQRVTVINILSAIRAKLEGTVNGSMALLKGVASFISLNPNVTQDDFATFSSTLIQEHPQIRNIGAAPDLVIQLMYPIAGNEKAVGLDYRKTPLQWKAVERVVKTGVMALAGPIDLVQGGTGLIGRIPVYEGGNTGPFWGIVSGVIDMPSVYRIAGIFNPALALDLKIQGKDGLGSEGDFFYGQKTDLDNEAISLKVSVPNGEWVLLATPKGGWQTTHPDRQLYLFSTTTIVLMLNILTFMFIYFRSGRVKDRLFVRESEQQKRLILETVPDLIWLKGADGVYLACNPMFERFFGAAEADIIGKTDYDFVDEELADAFRKFDLITMEADQSSTNEEWVTFSDDGRKVLLETIKTPFKGNNGEKLGILGIGRDITKRNIVEKALIDSEHWLAESQNVAHLGHYTLDTKTGLWKSSKALDDVFGIGENFTRNVEGWLKLIHPDFLEEMSIYLQDNILKRYQTFDKQYKIVDYKTKREKWVHGHGSLKFDNKNIPISMFGTILDVTESKLAEIQLIKAKNEAEHASKAKSEFLASMSHELRTPLNAVLGFAQMLQFDPKNPLSKAQSLHVESIVEGGDHLLELINQILDLARIEADQVSLSLNKVNAVEVAKDCINLMSPLGNSRDIQIINNISDENLPYLRTDQTRFKQSLINLLSNAVKYNKEGGTVTLNYQEIDKGYLRISVTDTGIGIAKDDYSGVFQIFNRLGADPMITKEGTGIGLPVTKMLVELMSGRVGFESEEGAGSTFWIELPLASNEDVLIWADNLRVGVDAIDKDHQELIFLTNKLSYEDIGEEELNDVLGELVNYAKYHFTREETIMEVCGYSDLERHRELHNDLATKINEMADQWHEERTSELLIHLRKFMRDWLIDHVMKVDMEIAKYTKGKNQEIITALGMSRFTPPPELIDKP